MCGWLKYYENPYQASLGSKFHAEIWCPLLTNAKGEGALDCYFCGERFKDFGPLAEHVLTAHGVDSFKERDMIKVRRQQHGTDGQGQKGTQFLSPRHVTSKGGHIAKITKVTTDKPDNFGNPYVVYFVMDGDATKYSKGFKDTSSLLGNLVDLFGEDESKWPGKSLVIGKQVDEDGAERLTFSQVPGRK